MKQNLLSVVVLAWNQEDLTRRCVESIRSNTDVPYELIVVDNGSEEPGRTLAAEVADRSILNDSNLGFAAGMNLGLEAAEGEYIAFVNNDTRLPPKWASRLLETFEAHPDAGIVLPAVTSAGSPRTVRTEPGTTVEVIEAFGELPGGIIYLMPIEIARGVGGWSTEYPIASSEDLDLLFTIWTNGLEVVFDSRVLVWHAHSATVTQLDNRQALYDGNLDIFTTKWSSATNDPPKLDSCQQDDFDANRAKARIAAIWFARLVEQNRLRRDTVSRLKAQKQKSIEDAELIAKLRLDLREARQSRAGILHRAKKRLARSRTK